MVERDATVPPLQTDVPPTFFDSGRVLEGESRIVAANWRTGPEGGLDEIHRYLHRDSRLLLNTKATMPLGHVGVKAHCEVVEADDGPKGVIDHFNPGTVYFEADIQDQKGMVTASQPLRSIRRRQQRLDLGPGQKPHQCAPLSLVRNRQHSLDGSAVRRRFQRGVTKKRPDGRQTEVPTSGAIVSAVLQIFQERPD